MKKLFLFCLMVLIFSACEVNPQAINYGNEACAYCKMTIVDKQHASQLVNKNGKAYNFDAIECMLHYSEENKDIEYELRLINDFSKPGDLINAKSATYLVSPEIKSPMGANLSGFSSKVAAQEAKRKYNGELYSWESIAKKISQ